MIARKELAIHATLFAVIGVFAPIGCGDDTGLGKRYPVYGKVTYKGQPVDKARISFTPTTPDARPAAGKVENGKYSLTTLAPNDGAIPGKYKVTLLAVEVDTKDMEAIAKGGQFHHDATFAKAAKNAKMLIPSKYSLADTSGLEKEVKAESNSIDFDLVD